MSRAFHFERYIRFEFDFRFVFMIQNNKFINVRPTFLLNNIISTTHIVV